MGNITKIVNGGYFQIQWATPVFSSDVIQDYWEADNNDNICKINVQLLYNSNSVILLKEPEILKTLDKSNFNKTQLNFSEFLIKNEKFDNSHQSLFEDNIIFSYQTTDECKITNETIIERLTEDVYVIFNKDLILKYLIIKKISNFKYVNIDSDLSVISNEVRIKIIELYFEIYTYNQNYKAEIKSLIDKIIKFIKETVELDVNIINFFNDEISHLREELQ